MVRVMERGGRSIYYGSHRGSGRLDDLVLLLWRDENADDQ